MIGLRHEVGGDWYSYLFRFDQIKNWGLDLSLENIITKDIGYDFINWLSAKAGLGIYGANFLCTYISDWFIYLSRNSEKQILWTSKKDGYVSMIDIIDVRDRTIVGTHLGQKSKSKNFIK